VRDLGPALGDIAQDHGRLYLSELATLFNNIVSGAFFAPDQIELAGAKT
jgi:hypothetical protein